MKLSHNCRFCDARLEETFIDLGISPLSNSYLTSEQVNKKEIFYPLHTKICKKCFLVQLPEFEPPEIIFKDYAYFSSYSESWLGHVNRYTNMMIERFSINSKWQVIEIASNDGYLLQFFRNQNIPVLGIEPAENVAMVARDKDIPTESVFFGTSVAKNILARGIKANLLIANNVLAHVPDINDFVSGLKILLAKDGILTLEFPHLLRLIEGNQFDTIYHEHFSYFSFLTAQKIFSKHQLCVFDVEEISVHGGSLRIYVKHLDNNEQKISEKVGQLEMEERQFGLDNIKAYQNFSSKIANLKEDLITFILEIKKSKKKIVGYGAPAKGNTLLNYSGINSDLLPFTVDKNPYKQGRFLPGTHIPILHPHKINEEKPDYLLLLPWNLKDEIIEQMNYIREWNGKFVVPIPLLQII